MKLYLETSHSESSRKTAVEFFSNNNQHVKAVDYFLEESSIVDILQVFKCGSAQ